MSGQEKPPEGTRLRVVSDLSRCIGAGLCVGLAPGTFELGADGQVLVLRSQVDGETPEETLEGIRRAIDSCPTAALSLREEQDSQPS